MTAIKSICRPTLYDTEGYFDDYYNSDLSQRDPYKFEYIQAGKAENGGASASSQAGMLNNNLCTDFRIQQNGIPSADEAMDSSFTGIRSSHAGSMKSYDFHNPQAQCSQPVKSKRERFSDFTTSPTAITNGMTSGLSPYNKYLNSALPPSGKCKPDAMNEIKESLDSFKDGVLYSITFGQRKKETFCDCMPHHEVPKICGKAIGGTIVAIIIWLIISCFIACILFGKAAACPSKSYSPCPFSGVQDILLLECGASSQQAGQKTKGGSTFSNFMRTVGQVAVSPFVSVANLITGGYKKKAVCNNKPLSFQKPITSSTMSGRGNLRPCDCVL